MKKKLILLAALYYLSIIVSSCCKGQLFFEISFQETEVARVKEGYFPTFIISAINPKEDSGFLNGAIANLRGFKSVSAHQKCPEDITTFKKVITSIEITSNNDFDTLFTAGTILNNLFEIKLIEKTNKGGDPRYNFEYQEDLWFTKDNILGRIELINSVDSVNIHDIYFEYKFDNGEIHKDTLLNQNFSRNSAFKYQ